MDCLRHRTLPAALLLVALAGCLSSDPDGHAVRGKPGLGPSTEPPTGTPFDLPEGLELAATLHGFGHEDEEVCPQYDEDLDFHGAGGTVTVCLALRNTTGAPVPLELPPGLIFESRDVTDQNGMILQRVSIVVPPVDRALYAVAAFCANESRHVPGGDSLFDLGPVTNDDDVHELIELVEGADLVPVWEANETQQRDLAVVGLALWDVTNGEGLDDERRISLASLLQR